MSGPVLQEPSTFSVLEASEAFFQEHGNDTRFENVEITEYFPNSQVFGAKTVEIYIPAQTTNLIYLWHEHVLEMQMRMVLKDGSIIPVGTTVVAPVNNIVDSMIDRVTIRLNGSMINQNDDKYQYRAYMTKLLSFPPEAKKSWLQSAGWYPDVYGTTDPSLMTTGSNGFKNRRWLFMKPTGTYQDPTVFSNEYVTFYSQIHNDLQTMRCGILPGIRMKIKIDFTKNAFRIVSKEFEGAVMQINKISIHLPIARVNPNLISHIETKLAKHDAQIYYKRFEMLNYTINRKQQNFNQEIQIGTGGGPSRILVAFVTLKQYLGDFHTNPYAFSRRWTSTTAATATTPEVTEVCWVKSVKISLNGKELDCMNAEATEFDDPVSFMRLNQLQGLIGSPTGNGIEYRDWLDFCAIYMFDLSTSGKSGESSDFLTPIVKTGSIRLDVQFNGPTLTEMKSLIFLELPSALTINKHRQMNFSYYNAEH